MVDIPGLGSGVARRNMWDTDRLNLKPAQDLKVKNKNTFLHCDSESYADMMARLSTRRPVSDPGVFAAERAELAASEPG